jgi:hypothetical protein
MEKSLVRAFLFSLLVFLVLNFLFFIVGYSIAGLIDLPLDRIANHPTHSIYLLTYPCRFFPWNIIEYFLSSSSPGLKILYLGGFISFVVAAIVAGLMGGDIGKSFGGWILTSLCYTGLFIFMITIDSFNLDYICFACTYTEAVVEVLIACIVNMLIFSALVLLIALLKGRS